MNGVEDENNFLLVCPRYEEIRTRYLHKFWITLKGVEIKDSIVNQEQITITTAIYTFYALKLREELI